ncbi:MAG: hypothetical protein NVSMB6_14290 [Burkholderiaceae bacterium]
MKAVVLTCAILVGMTCTSGLAQERLPDGSGMAGGSVTASGIAYRCGGVDDGGQKAMKAAMPGFDLALTFATSDGAYLADVNIEIADARGKAVLSLHCDGPMLLVDLPRSGTYRIRATAEGRTLTRTASVRHGGRSQMVGMSWPVVTQDVGASPTSPK